MVWIIGSVVVVLLFACLGLGVVGYAATRHPKSPAATGDPAGPSSAAPAGQPGALARYLVPLPPDARPWPNQPAEGELSDLEAARRELDSPGVDVGFLDEDQFQGGYERRWIDGKGTSIEAHLFQFQGAGGAAHYARMTQGTFELVMGWGEPKPVPGVGGATIQIQTHAEKYVWAGGVVVRDNLVAVISVKALPPYDPKPLSTLLAQEAQLLP